MRVGREASLDADQLVLQRRRDLPGTARADDPDLTVRELGAAHQPIRIVLDSRLSHSAESRLGQTARAHPVWMLHGPNAPAEARAAWMHTGAILLEVAVEHGHLDPRAAMQTLAAQGLTRVFCEGGGTLAAALIKAELIDDLALFSAGALIGADGQPSLGPLGLAALQDAPRLSLRETRSFGPDAYSLWSAR